MPPPPFNARSAWDKIRSRLLKSIAKQHPRMTLSELVFSKSGHVRLREGVTKLENLEAASIYELLNDFSASKWKLTTANCGSPAKHYLEKLIEQQETPRKRRYVEAESKLGAEEVAGECQGFDLKPFLSTFSKTLPIKRVPSENITAESFFLNYSTQHKPLLISNHRTLPRWTFEDFKILFEGCSTMASRFNPSALEWAGIEGNSEQISMEEFLVEAQTPGYENQIFDISILRDDYLRQSLGREMRIPKFFANDFLKRLAGEKMDGAWPSLFISPQGTGSGLHIDAMSSHFWLGVTSGCKLFRMFPPDYLLQLGGKFIYESLAFPHDWDERARDFELHWAVVGPGDLIFVPANWAHKVDNLAPTIAISGNFIDKSNVEEAIQDSEISGILEADSFELAQDLATLTETGGDKMEFLDSDPYLLKQQGT